MFISNTQLSNGLTVSTEAGDPTISKRKKVFLVHGRDERILKKVEKLLEEMELEGIVLHKNVSEGRSVFENLDYHTDVKAAVVIYTPDDLGKFCTDKDLQARARMNVIFEHGFLLAKLGQKKVVMVVDGDIELPTDVGGITYIHTSTAKWIDKVKAELDVMGLDHVEKE